MLKKVLVGILSVTVLGAAGGALIWQSANQANAASAPLYEAEPTAVAEPGNGQRGNTNQVQAQNQAEPVRQMAAQEMVGEPWTASGRISELDEFGMTFLLEDGSEIYVEFGPPNFWQAQNVALAVGDVVTVEGFASEIGYHAAVVNTADGQQIQLRTAEGQPLWSGGATNGQGNSGASVGNANASGLQDGEHVPQPQAQVDEWVTVEGIITAINRSQVTMLTVDGQTLSFQMGQPRFMEAQGVTLTVGNEISVLGFYQNEQFSAGEVTLLATGDTVMLRDPNGRPLWAGPGGNQNSNGNGQRQ